MKRVQQDIQTLCDLHTPWSDEDRAQIEKVDGPRPLLREPVKRQPYDELYIKQKNSRDYWSRN